MSGFKWVYKTNEIDPGIFSEIRKAAGSDIIARLLINRGITDLEAIKKFLNPGEVELTSPFVFPDMQKAVDRINMAINNRENIVVYGDFDSDGVTSASLMYKALLHIGADVDYYIPDRSDEGHGLNRAALIKLMSTKKTKLFITVDCGITNFAETKLTQGLGVDVIITDHHEPLEELPEAFAIINPKMIDIPSIRYLAGVGVAYKLAEGLLISHNKNDYIDKLLPLVAIGTVGDVVPLTDENRTLVYKGLLLINRDKPHYITKLLEYSGTKPDKKITSTVLGFTIVPRINAIGRLSDAFSAVEFLVSDDPERIDALAKELDRNNKDRQHLCDDNFQEAEQILEKLEVDLDKDRAIILGDETWHPGIIGLVASRLVEKYNRPALLFSIDETKKEARCSARSINGLNIFEVLNGLSEYFIQFGGHSLAAGFVANLEKIDFESLKARILSQINSILNKEQLMPELHIDLDLKIDDVDEDLIRELDKLAPYGELNPYPVFSISDLTLKGFNTMGPKKNHLKIFLSNSNGTQVEAIWWQRKTLDIRPEEKINVAFVPSINHFNDRKIIQLIVKDIAPCHPEQREESFDHTRWIDHREETGFKRELLDYLKSIGDDLYVFAESPRALEIIEKVSFLKPNVVDRTSIAKADYLVLLDFPPDDDTFINIIKKSNPAEVHLFGLVNEYDPIELIKKISGMFRYAYNEKNGIIDLNRAASSLAISNELLFSCAELLNNAQVIEIGKVKDEKSMEFRFIGSVNLNTIQELPAYYHFINALNEFTELKTSYKTVEIELLQQTLENLETFQNLS